MPRGPNFAPATPDTLTGCGMPIIHQAESSTCTPMSRKAPPPASMKPRFQSGIPLRLMLRARP